MNPLEDRHRYDCLYYGHGEKAIDEQNKGLKRVGVTPERNLDVWNGYKAFNEYYQNAVTEETFKTRIFTYNPIRYKQTFTYGDYTFQAISQRQIHRKPCLEWSANLQRLRILPCMRIKAFQKSQSDYCKGQWKIRML